MISKIKFNIFLLCIIINCVKTLDINENADELEIYRRIFVKLNRIIEGNDAVQKDMISIEERIHNMETNLFSDKISQIEAFKKDRTKAAANCDFNNTTTSIEVFDHNCIGNNWTLIQKRKDGSENFYRNWNDYKIGFGHKLNEFFVGLEELQRLTSLKPHELLIVLEDFDNSKRYARYDLFEVGSETEQYALKALGSYSGNAGDSFSYHKGSKFSTKDQDNDQHPDLNCAEKLKSAWWFKACHESNLNGCYSDANLRDSGNALACGIHWRTFRGQWYSLKSVEIMIRPLVHK